VKQETLKALADGSNVLTASTGVTSSVYAAAEYWDFVNTNAAGIGVLATIIFGFIAIGFNIYNSFKLGKADKNEVVIDEHGEKLDAHIQDTVAEFANVNSGISEILSKLDKQG